MIKLLVILCLFFSSYLAIAQLDSTATINSLKKDIEYLASDSLKGRFPGTYGAELAANRIENRLKSIGVKSMHNCYRDYFIIQAENKQIETFNIIARINANKPCKLILVAHYDHLGLGDRHSREVNLPIIHNGADDNASGVAMLLLLAEEFQKRSKQLPYGVVIIFTSGHELGLYGANHFVKFNGHLLNKNPYVLNFDMIGRLSNDQNGKGNLYFRVDENHFWDFAELPVSDQSLNLIVKTLETPLDQTSFYDKKLKAATFSTGIHSDYHKSTDDDKFINYQGMYLIYTFLKAYIKHITSV